MGDDSLDPYCLSMVTKQMNKNIQRFHIHGDNIVECERTLHLIKQGFKDEEVELRGPLGVPTNPEFHLQFDSDLPTLEFVFFPGFQRWNHDIHELVLERGGVLNESADALLSDVTSGQEELILAIEFSGALAAGNQAWQRNGRAYSFGLAGIPYLYVAELGGYELRGDRSRKSPRFPNPAVPFSYLSFSAAADVPVLPIFVSSPVMDDANRTDYAHVFGEADLEKFVRLTILGEDTAETVSAIEEKTIRFIHQLASRKRSQSITPEQWSGAYQHIKGEKGRSVTSYLETEAPKNWSKTVSISRLTNSAKLLMDRTSELAIGLTYPRLPFCLIQSHNRHKFSDLVKQLYSEPTVSARIISDDFLEWLQKKRPLTICWVNGFKPRGDDARPDRGLPPFARMLIGPDIDMLTVVYGPALPLHWEKLVEEPQDLAERNGLWQAILGISDAILIDSDSDKITAHGYTRSHWQYD